MPDRLPIVLCYVQQGCRPIPCQAGTKHARDSWTRFQRHDPTVHNRHRWWTGTRQNNENVALILGPPPGGNLLAMNVNVKNGHDGPATLHRLSWVMPPTPTIRTPSGGLCYFFKVPDPSIYRFPFGTYVHPPGYDGLEFRGAKSYQLVPTSRTPEGCYEFLPPWTLDRFRADLAELPGAILQAWTRLDGGAKIFGRDEPVTIGTTRKPAPTAVLITDLSPPQPQPTSTAQNHPQHLTTKTTTLLHWKDRDFTTEDYTDFDGGEVGYDDGACTAHVCGLVRLDVSALSGAWPFPCILPRHGPDRDPSATRFQTSSGHYLYHDWHARSGDEFWPVPDVFAALVTGKVKRLPKPSRKTWRLRLMVEAGLLEPYPVEMKPIPDDLPKLLRHFCERFRYLCACKWTYQERAPTMFSDEFAAGWCGIREGSIWKLRRLAMAHGFMVVARDDQGHLVYLPGKESAS
jgi:hypothetical protein